MSACGAGLPGTGSTRPRVASIVRPRTLLARGAQPKAVFADHIATDFTDAPSGDTATEDELGLVLFQGAPFAHRVIPELPRGQVIAAGEFPYAALQYLLLLPSPRARTLRPADPGSIRW